MSLVQGQKNKYRCQICDVHFDSYAARLKHLDDVHDLKGSAGVVYAMFQTIRLRLAHYKVVQVDIVQWTIGIALERNFG